MSASETISGAERWAPPADLGRLHKNAWLVGAVAGLACVLGAFLDTRQFLHSYLVAWLLWLGVAAGCLALLALHHLSRGGWGLMIRRVLEAAARTIPFLAIGFLPVLLRLPDIYPWAAEDAHDLGAKARYLDETWFVVRSLGFLALWSFMAWVLSTLSARQDATGERGLFRRMQTLAGPILGLYALTATFASVDWVMSLDPHWYSSLFGVYFIGGHAVSALAFVVPMALYLSRRPPLDGVFKRHFFHDYGKLMLAFVMLWAYFAVSQLLIIWSANIAEETGWYVERTRGGWGFVALALALLHFALPFLLLLSRNLKRDARRLALVAGMLLAMRWFDLYWQAAPVFSPEGMSLHWLDPATVIAVGAIWFALFVGQLRRRPLLPFNAPDLEEALARE